MPRCAIFVPAYNAALTLPEVIARVPAELWDSIDRVFVINDGSQDATDAVVEKLHAEHPKVELVRHAYVEPTAQGKGIGTRLLRHVLGLATKPVLVGTWADAIWAIEFYRKNGFKTVPATDKDRLLRQYWSIPERQIETSVVLANDRWTTN